MDFTADEIAVAPGSYPTLSSKEYTDDAVFQRERDRIFARTWQLVGHQTQLPNPGDFRTVEVEGESIVVIHGTDGQLRAFYNICIHRGHELVEGHGNQKRLTCKYHAWCYDTLGRVERVPNGSKVPGFSAEGLAMKPVALEIFHGLLFVNLDPDAAPLGGSLGATELEIAEYLPGLAQSHFAHRTEAVLKANWKVVIENFSECYHCIVVHKTFTQGVVAADSYRIVARGASHLHHSTPKMDGQQSYAFDADPDAKTDLFAAWYLWPLTGIQVYPGGIGMTFRWIPIGPDETKVEADWWLPSPTPSAVEKELIDQHAATTFWEDVPLVESVQRSMHSRGFDKGMILVDEDRSQNSEHGMKAFNDLYREVMEE